MVRVLSFDELDLALEVLLLLLGRDSCVDIVLSLVFIGLFWRLELISSMTTFSSYVVELALISPSSNCFG